MKILFLDVDGVLNCESYMKQEARGGIVGIDPFRALLIHRICEATGCKIVVSSSWRHSQKDMEQVKEAVGPFNVIDKTPTIHQEGIYKYSRAELCERGHEIKAWMSEWNRNLDDIKKPEIEKYAILDDDNDMLPEQQVNFFQTKWHGDGLTEEIAQKVIEHLNSV